MKENWTHSNQEGCPGHCYLAQVWDSEGKSIAVIESQEDPEVANMAVRLMAAAPEMCEALEKIATGAHPSTDGEAWQFVEIAKRIAIEALSKAMGGEK